ncbi:MAG: hypothetical protein JWM64_1386 [Frankiales bacterium]|nr:hypothetical protein [Frankiales bacterium]
MPLFSRRPRGPLPLPLPAPDGAGWPSTDDVGRPTFAASALHESGLRNAYEIEAHAAADRLVDQLLPLLPTGATEQDAPFLRKVLLTAARIGAGVGMVARTGDAPAGPSPDTVDRDVAGALLLARGALPHMPPHQAHLAGYFLLAGFRTTRLGPDEVDRLQERLGHTTA